MTEPLAQIDVTIACLDNVGSGNTPVVYSGDRILVRSQFGILVISPFAQGGQLRNGIHRGDAGYCGGTVRMYGDFHQSVNTIRATAGEKKWIVGNGISSNCVTAPPESDRISGLNVWRWSGTRYDYKGYIDTCPPGSSGCPSGRIDENDPTHLLVLNGDFAYAQNGAHNVWFKFDLINMTWGTVSAPPESEEQTSINGATYRFEVVQEPASPPNIHPGIYRFEKENAVALPTFCPNDKIDRKQAVAIIYNALVWLAEHPGEGIPPDPLTQQFSDVPDENPFSTAINAFGAAGIVAGKPVCDVP